MSENTNYATDAPEGSSPAGTQYFSKKDAKWMVLVTAFLIVGFIPVYLFMREKAWKSTCTKNLGGIMEGVMLYATDNDNRLPPTFESTASGEPAVGADGLAITWVSLVQPHKSERVSFVCPAADKEEYAYSASYDGSTPIPSTYGYYGIYASQTLDLIDNPDQVLLLTETANGGANNTYDPMPYKTSKYDGMIIGWDDSNAEPSENTQAVTRLAFKDTKGKSFSQKNGRHGLSNHAISAARGRVIITSDVIATEYDRTKYTLRGYWREPILRN
jgi:hypothetical protein